VLEQVSKERGLELIYIITPPRSFFFWGLSSLSLSLPATLSLQLLVMCITPWQETNLQALKIVMFWKQPCHMTQLRHLHWQKFGTRKTCTPTPNVLSDSRRDSCSRCCWHYFAMSLSGEWLGRGKPRSAYSLCVMHVDMYAYIHTYTLYVYMSK